MPPATGWSKTFRFAAWLALIVLLNTPHRARAGRELSEYDFSLRFPAATSRFASYPDVAALGGAQAGSEWQSSLNPASAAWPHPERKVRHSIAAQFSTVHFAEGSRLDVYAEAPFIDAGEWGVFLPAAAQIRSNQATTRPGPRDPTNPVDPVGPEFDFEADYFQLQWAKLVHERWAIGGLVSITSSETTFEQGGMEAVRVRSETYTARLGVVHQALPKFRVGAAVEYAATPSRTRTLVGARLLSVDPLTFAPIRARTSDTTHQVLLRTGLTWEYAEGCDFYLDYHGGAFWDDSGELWVHRFPVGLEQMLIPDILWARVGGTFDTRGSVVMTAGLGLSLGSRASFDCAYQKGAFPEIRPELGAADAFIVSLAVGF